MLPKRRVSRANVRTRKSQWKAVATPLSLCPKCEAPKRAHFACPSCGYYKNTQYNEAITN